LTASDHSVRQEAIEPTRSFCVSAPAGSGKTELLTQRLLALLARVDRPEQVLAITFTRKAASEMALRVMEKLDQARENVPVTLEHERQTRALALAVIDHAAHKQWQLDDTTLNIRTIDSFCHELTRQMPILSGTGGLIEPVDNAQPLYEEAVRQFLAEAGEGATGERIYRLLEHFDNRWSRASELLVALLGRRGDWGNVVNQHHDPETAEASLAETITHLSSDRLRDALHRLDDHLSALMPAINEARAQLDKAPLSLSDSPESLPDWHAMIGMLLTAQSEWRKPRGVNAKLGFPPKSDHKIQFASVLETLGADSLLLEALIEIKHLPATTRGGDAWQLIVLISSLLPVLQAHLLLVFQRSGAVDHTHVALAAIQALGTDEMPTALAQRLDYQIEHILIDEFQDTSSSQARFLERLMRGWPEHNATGAAPRTLFMVGDAMQSIYGFRYADVALFLRARQGHFAGLALEAVTLTQNFRSRPEVVAWVNAAFAELMGAEDAPHYGRVRHVKADSLPNREPSVDAGVHIRLFEESDGHGEAQFVAKQVAGIIARDDAAKIAILVRAKRHAGEAAVALEQAGIAFSGDAIQSLAEQPITTDLLTLCRYLANPAHTVAAVSLLRGPWCGVSLPTLARLLAAHPERPLNLMRALEQLPGIADDEATRLQQISAVLQWAEMKRDRLALSIWVEQIWLRLGGALATPSQDLRCVEAFLAALRKAEKLGLGLDLDWLELEITTTGLESPDTGHAVTIMTLHKAKGLEFDYVFMPHLQKRARAVQRELIRWHWHQDDSDRRLLLSANDDDKESRTLYNYLNWIQKNKDQEELKRLLYVGVTRAKVAAYLTASVDSVEEKSATEGVSGSLLRLLMSSQAASNGVTTQSVTEPVSHDDHSTYGKERQPFRYRLTLDAQKAMQAGAHVGAGQPNFAAINPSNTAPISLGTGNRVERIIGVVAHRVLELAASEASLVSAGDPRVQLWINHNLSHYALTPQSAERAKSRVSELAERALSCETGRWILGAQTDARSELAVSRVEAGEVKNYIIDRTFLDDQEGVRWVIDYKTSEPMAGEPLADFEAREKDTYREQLEDYVELISEMQWTVEAPIKAALYFPAIQHLSVCK
jgi:ATP-dependent helicase/nuclease subunit A